jgi:hypothetical protein
MFFGIVLERSKNKIFYRTNENIIRDDEKRLEIIAQVYMHISAANINVTSD